MTAPNMLERWRRAGLFDGWGGWAWSSDILQPEYRKYAARLAPLFSQPESGMICELVSGEARAATWNELESLIRAVLDCPGTTYRHVLGPIVDVVDNNDPSSNFLLRIPRDYDLPHEVRLSNDRNVVHWIRVRRPSPIEGEGGSRWIDAIHIESYHPPVQGSPRTTYDFRLPPVGERNDDMKCVAMALDHALSPRWDYALHMSDRIMRDVVETTPILTSVEMDRLYFHVQENEPLPFGATGGNALMEIYHQLPA